MECFLYLALYPMAPSPFRDAKYHVAILLVPREPDTAKQETTRYHATDRTGWKFERVQAYNRTYDLGSVALLGKLPAGKQEDDVHAVLRGVPLHVDDSDWDCVHWATDAVHVRIAIS